MALPAPHSTLTTPFSIRAGTKNTPPLASYLLSLISIKRSNLCVSADVCTTAELLRVAEEVGNHICILKTHADIIDDWSNNTIARLQEVAIRKHFLLFEDRKFGDIGNTLQLQYTHGPLRIASWAHLTNAHLLPGPTIVPVLHAAAQAHLISLNQSVSTEISAGPPPPDADDGEEEDSSTPQDSSHTTVTTTTTTSRDFANERNPMTEATTTQPPPPAPGPSASSQLDSTDNDDDADNQMLRTHRRNYSGSAFATTTITQSSEPLSPHKPPPSLMKSLSQNEEEDEEERPSSASLPRNNVHNAIGAATTQSSSSQGSYIPSTHLLKDLGPPPHARGLLLLAEMSSEGNLTTKSYTEKCVETAQANRDFVLGFISQRSLNIAEADNFLCMAPGVNLPSEAEEREREREAAAAMPAKSDGRGQQYRDPKEVIGRDGIDVVILGRGILNAEDRGREAERYRRKAWEAYEARIGRRSSVAG